MYDYIMSHNTDIKIGDRVILNENMLSNAICLTNRNLQRIHEITRDSGIEVFEALGMRNLSGFVGEFLVSSLEKSSENRLIKNPHQDGYPDLLAVDTEESREHFNNTVTIGENNKRYPKEKFLFSPYKYGGIEVKATCGSTPKADIMPKPLIGEERINKLESFDWKAHHRDTNNLIGVLWDFIEGVPTITVVFYRNDLTEDDWGKIVTPKEDGGRTTSVSIMKTAGVNKMCENWLAVINLEEYIDKLADNKWIGYRVSESSQKIANDLF